MYSSSNDGGPEIALIKNEKIKSLELCIDSLRNFIYCKNRINKVISKYEIKFDYLIDENGEYESSGWCEDVLDNIFNNNVDDETFEKYLLGYIFNNKSSCQCFNNNYFSSDNDLPQGSKYKNFYEYC